jgi:CubicO group peptidase (beta-lactamase class C family)
VLRDGAPAVAYARRTGGRFNEKGLPIASDGDKAAFLHDLAQRLPKDAVVELHESMHGNWSQIWALGGRVVKMNQRLPTRAAGGKDKPYLLSSRFASEEHLATVAGRFHVTAVGQFWMVDPRGGNIGGCCLSITLADYARMGQFALDGGKGVVPDGWFAEATDSAVDFGESGFGYGYQWWTYPQGTYGAQGIFGQAITLFPGQRPGQGVVVAYIGNWKQASGGAERGDPRLFGRHPAPQGARGRAASHGTGEAGGA